MSAINKVIKVFFDQRVPEKYSNLVKEAQELWYSDLASKAIKTHGLKKMELIIEEILKEVRKSASERSVSSQQMFTEIVKIVGHEYLKWMEFCDKNFYFSSEDYSPERCQWTKYLTIDRLKSVCPNNTCSKPKEMCRDCMKKYVADYVHHISAETKEHLNSVYGRGSNFAAALWITYQQAHSDSPEYSGYYLRDITESDDAYRLHLIDNKPDHNLLLLGAITGNVATIDHYMETPVDTMWYYIAHRFLQLWPGMKERSYSVGYSLAMDKLIYSDQQFLASGDITQKLLDWDNHRQQLTYVGWPLECIEKEVDTFISELGTLCDSDNVSADQLFQLLYEAKPQVRYQAARKLGPIIWKAINRRPGPDISTIRRIFSAYEPDVKNVLRFLFIDIEFVNQLASVRELYYIDQFLVETTERPFYKKALFYKARATAHLLCNRYIKIHPASKMVMALLLWLYPVRHMREANVEEMITENPVFHETLLDQPYDIFALEGLNCEDQEINPL